MRETVLWALVLRLTLYTKEGNGIMFLEKTCYSLPLQEWIKGFHVLLRKNPSSQFR
jgi:hypothetical protein